MKKFLKIATVLFIITLFPSCHFILAEELPVESQFPLPVSLVESATGEFPTVVGLENLPITVHLNIKTATSELYNNDISVINCDSDNNPENEKTISAYCAVLQTEIPSDWNWDWAPGAYINSLSSISGYTTKDALGNNVYHYWSWSLNGEYANDALNQYLLKPNDLIELIFIDPTIEIPDKVTPNDSGSTGSSGITTHEKDEVVSNETAVKQALLFLSSQQKSDGSFGRAFYTDWVAIGISKTNDEMKEQLLNNLLESDYKGNNATDFERRAMAYLALGINPRSDTEINYIEKILALYDGEQIGDPNLINDDIFGLLVLSKVGYDENDEIIQKISNHIVDSQSADGSYESVDLTAAAIQALSNLKGDKKVKNSLNLANQYLIDNQETDGGYGNSFSTSWAILALSISDDDSETINRAISYLKKIQETDGGYPGVNGESRIWATAYSVPALMKLSWNDILVSFEKEEDNIIDDEDIESEVVSEDIPLVPTVTSNVVETIVPTLSPVNQVFLKESNLLDNRASRNVISNHNGKKKLIDKVLNESNSTNLQVASVGTVAREELSLKTIISILGAKLKALISILWDSWQF